jgi:transposase
MFIVCNPAEMVRADDSECPKDYNYSTTIIQLKTQLFCSYDTFTRPVRQHNDTVDVKLQLVVKKIQFVSMTNSSHTSMETN